jgi:diamine N-acetyltransferase
LLLEVFYKKDMILIKTASVNDISAIREITRKIWPVTYGEILSQEQLEYMMDLIYSDNSLLLQIQNNHQFFIVSEGLTNLGFASFEHHYLNKSVTKLHKLYLLPESQGRGIGKLLIESIAVLAKENQSEIISLNVNRFNKAYAFYKKMGFEIVAEEDLEIGNGYLMEDYKMEKKV